MATRAYKLRSGRKACKKPCSRRRAKSAERAIEAAERLYERRCHVADWWLSDGLSWRSRYRPDTSWVDL
jgi:hypothetical protein